MIPYKYKILLGLSLATNLIFAFFILKKVIFLYSLKKEISNETELTIATKSRITSNDIVFVGDSETANFPLSILFKDSTLKNRGISGDTTFGVLRRIDTIVLRHPKKIFICIGINDLLKSIAIDTALHNIAETIEKIKIISPQSKIYFQSVLPSTWKKWDGTAFVLTDIIIFNSRLSTLCKVQNIQFIDLYNKFKKGRGMDYKYDCGDHLHLNDTGYLEWKLLITPFVSN